MSCRCSMSNITMQLPWSSSQHEIKVEIKEEVIDIHDEIEYSCDDSLCERGGDDCISNVNNLNISYTEEKSSSHKAELKDIQDEYHSRPTLDQRSCDPDFIPSHSSIQSTASQFPVKLQQTKAPNKIIRMISPPRTFTPRWCNTKRAHLIIQFLENFAKISRSSKYTECANFNRASFGPRLLTCEKCSFQFSGLHDRYLKIFLHYKTCHKETCNKLIGLKWVKHQVHTECMMLAWQKDLQYIEEQKIM